MRFTLRQGRRYYYYDTYNTWRQAYTVARYYKRHDKNKYWIFIDGRYSKTKYRLYMTKIIPLT